MFLFQTGCFVSAMSVTLGVVDRVFARVGASDNVVKNMSTFQMEMTETANILSNATANSFVILDEIGTIRLCSFVCVCVCVRVCVHVYVPWAIAFSIFHF